MCRRISPRRRRPLPVPHDPDRIRFKQDVLARLVDIEHALGRIEHALDLLGGSVRTEETHLMAFIDDLEASVAHEKTVDDSIIALLNSLHQALVDAGVDPARQAAVLAALQGEQDRIAAAVTANTPAAP